MHAQALYNKTLHPDVVFPYSYLQKPLSINVKYNNRPCFIMCVFESLYTKGNLHAIYIYENMSVQFCRLRTHTCHKYANHPSSTSFYQRSCYFLLNVVFYSLLTGKTMKNQNLKCMRFMQSIASSAAGMDIPGNWTNVQLFIKEIQKFYIN